MTTLVPPPALVADPAQVEAIASAARSGGWLALDLEFMTEGRYVPELSLVQVGWGDIDEPNVAAIDPLHVEIAPIVALVSDPAIDLVIHSAQADLALLGALHGVRAAHLFDTQIAAAFLGWGDQIGYGALVERLTGVHLDKGAQFTEWSRRPLSDEQIRYALDDVRYLPRAWQTLRRELETRGRIAWVESECDALAAQWAERTPPEEAYRRIRGWNGLKRRALGALRGVAAWRETESLRSNRPPSWLINDRTLLELCRRPPTDVSDLAGVRGLGEGTIQRYGRAIVEAAQRGVADPPEVDETPPHLPNLGQAWPAVLTGIVQARCREADIAARFVATRRDIDEVIAWWLVGDRSTEPELPLLSGWRRSLVGQDVLDWLAGKTSVVVDPHTEAGLSIRG